MNVCGKGVATHTEMSVGRQTMQLHTERARRLSKHYYYANYR